MTSGGEEGKREKRLQKQRHKNTQKLKSSSFSNLTFLVKKIKPFIRKIIVITEKVKGFTEIVKEVTFDQKDKVRKRRRFHLERCLRHG